MEDLLRVQGVDLQEIELENQNGPLMRHLLVVAAELFPDGRQADVQELRLVFDTTQLHRLRALLQQLPPLPDWSQATPPSVQ